MTILAIDKIESICLNEVLDKYLITFSTNLSEYEIEVTKEQYELIKKTISELHIILGNGVMCTLIEKIAPIFEGKVIGDIIIIN